MIVNEALEWVLEQCSTLALGANPHSKVQPGRNDGAVYGLNAKWYVGRRQLPAGFWQHPVHFHDDLSAVQIMVCKCQFATVPRY